MRSSPRRRSQQFHQVLESLEARRLLTYVYDATAGNDSLEITGDVTSGTTIRIPGGASVTTPEPTIFIHLLDGNDRVEFKTLRSDTHVYIEGGDGDDVVEYLGGNLANDISGDIHFEEFSNDGNDRLTVLDNAGTTDHGVLRVNASTVFVNGSVGSSATFYPHGNVETHSITLNGFANQVQVSDIPSNFELHLGSGNDTVNYFNDDHAMPNTVRAMKVFGDAGTDAVVFDDTAGGTTGATYNITENAILNQAVVAIESATLRTRAAAGGSQSLLQATGLPALQTLSIDGTTNNTDINIGTASSRIDFDARGITINNNSPSPVALFDQDLDGLTFTWEVYTADNRTRQHVGKGFFDFNCGASQAVTIHGGSGQDRFEISGQIPDLDIGVHGGAGNDTLTTANRNAHANDLDDIFINGNFAFRGEDGDDLADLNDTADAINDGDAAYIVDERAIQKGDFSNPSANDLIGFTFGDVERISFTAGSDDNFFQLGGFFGTRISVFGAGGNDLFYNRASSGLGFGMTIDASLVGGPGTDRLQLNDAAASDFPRTDYQLDAAAFVAYRSGDARLATFRYDSTLERIDLTQNASATTTRINGKPAVTELAISDNGGNDQYIVGGGDLDASGLRLTNSTITDAAGVDFITFDDSLDTFDDTAQEIILGQSTAVSKDVAGVSFVGFEAQKFLLGDAGTGGSNLININSTASTMGDTQIIGGNSRPAAVNVANGLLSTLSGTMTIDLNAGGGSVNVNNQNAIANTDYTITTSMIDGPYTINISDVTLLQVNAGSGVDRFFVNGVASGTEVDAFGNNGNDEFYAGTGQLAALAGNVLFVGGAGSDFMRFSNAQAVCTTTATMTASTFNFGARTHAFSQIETAQITGSLLGSTFDIQGLPQGMNATVTGSNGADVVRFGNGDMDVTGSTLTFNGSGGSDRLELLDANDTGDSDAYTFSTVGSLDRVTKTAGTITVTVNSNDVERRVLNASAGSTLIQMSSTNSDLDINANAGDDNVRIDDAVARIVVNTGDGVDSLTVNADAGTSLDVPAAVTINSSDDIRNLDVKPLGVLHVESGGVIARSHVAGAVFNLQGTIDLNGGALISRSGGPSLNTFRSWILTGRNNNLWNGNGGSAGAINSSLAASTNTGVPDAIGYGSGAELIPLRLGDFNVAAGDVVMRYTVVGDADLNGRVNFDDYSRIDAGFNIGRTGWTNGDFDFNNVINFDDYALIDLAFNLQSPSGRPQRA